MDNDTLSHLKFQIKNDILEVLQKEIDSMKREVEDIKTNYNLLVGSVPDIIKQNIYTILQDYNYLKKGGCLNCCSKRK